jgi:hypothetical protein
MLDEQPTPSTPDTQADKLASGDTLPPAISQTSQTSPHTDTPAPGTTQPFTSPDNALASSQSPTRLRPTTFAPSNIYTRSQQDSPYRPFLIAFALLIICIVVLSLLSRALLQLPSLLGGAQIATTPPPGTVDIRPVFPTPGGQGSTQSSQPPPSGTPTIAPTTPTPTVTVTVTTTPTPGQSGTLTVQILSVPPVVANNTNVNVAVNANQAGVTVQLLVVYNVPPGIYESAQAITDSNGNAVLLWRVHVISQGQAVTARLNVSAHSPDGQQAMSTPITVQVVGAGAGG